MDSPRFCTKCGHEISVGAEFCAYCGTRVSGNTDPVSAGARYERYEENSPDIEGKAKWEGNVPQVITAETNYRCLVCGYIHHGINPPNQCPQCRAGADKFVLVRPQVPNATISCYKCGSVIPADSKYCPCCQILLKQKCPSCGHVYSSKYPSCPECGTNYKEALLKEQKEKEEREKQDEKEYLDFIKFLDDSDLVIVKGGSFLMGATPEQGLVKSNSDRTPVHSVTVDTFIISKYLVTLSIWYEVMGYNPSNYTNGMLPVESISFEELCSFIEAASEYYKLPFRLPTEAEWEYAARGGALSRGYKYPGGNDVAELGWIKSNSGGQTHPVGMKKPNELGLYDMAGNVWEIVEDIYDSKYYSKSPQVNPCNSKQRSDFSAWWHESYGDHVMRGGSFTCNADEATSSFRNEHIENSMFGHYKDVGFRLALDFPFNLFPNRG